MIFVAVSTNMVHSDMRDTDSNYMVMLFVVILVNGNWDGWNPSREEAILTTCKEKNILVPPRNDKGCVPRD